MRALCLAFTSMLALAGAATAEGIQGEYLEARNADVWTGPCFANGEMGIFGNHAILAWKVTSGEHRGVRLDDLGIAAIVMGNATFGIGEEVTTQTLFLVDERADANQREALIAMARDLAGDTIQEVVAVKNVPFSLNTSLCEGLGCAQLQAGDAVIQTRCLCDADSICGHEDLFYPALSRVSDSYAAYTLRCEYVGEVFRETFKDNNARSSVIGRFATSTL